jgi:hypothetical protein
LAVGEFIYNVYESAQISGAKRRDRFGVAVLVRIRVAWSLNLGYEIVYSGFFMSFGKPWAILLTEGGQTVRSNTEPLSTRLLCTYVRSFVGFFFLVRYSECFWPYFYSSLSSFILAIKLFS